MGSPTLHEVLRAFSEVRNVLLDLAIRLGRLEAVAKTERDLDFWPSPAMSWCVEAYRHDGRVFSWNLDFRLEGNRWAIWSNLSVNEPDDNNGSITVAALEDRHSTDDEGALVELLKGAKELAAVEMPE